MSDLGLEDTMAVPQYPVMSVEDYLLLDSSSKEARYEYLDGDLHMLAGGTMNHGIIIANLTGILYALLNDGPCGLYSADVRLQLSESRYVYPDLTISCDQRDNDSEDEMIHFPTVVTEVLSPGTEAFDRGKKFFYYREHLSIQEYMLINADSVQIEIYQREEDGWKLRTYGPGSYARLESLDIQFPVDVVYRRVRLREDKKNRKR
jgi:Uma2 family endonuclease